MMVTGPLLAWMQKLAVQHFTLEVENLFTQATTFTHLFQLLLVMYSFDITETSVNSMKIYDRKLKFRHINLEIMFKILTSKTVFTPRGK